MPVIIFGSAALLTGCGKTDLSDAEHVQRAKDYQDKRDIKASVIELKSALKQNPDNPEARWLLGRIYLDMENGAAAEKELTRARALGIDPAAIVVPLGRALLLQGKAEQVLTEIQVDPGAPPSVRASLLTLRGEANLASKKIDAAQADLSAALEACGGNKCSDTLLALAKLELSRRAVDEAKVWISKATVQDPGNGKVWRFLAELEQSQQHPQEALNAYAKAIQANPNDFAAILERAQVHLEMGNLDASKADMEAVRKVAPGYPDIRYLEGRQALVAKDAPKAQASLENFLKIRPGHLGAAYYLAVAHLAQGHDQQAEEQLLRLSSIDPNSLQVRKLLGLVQAQRGAVADAIKTLEPIARQNPDDVEVIKLLGRIYLRKGDLQIGVSYLERASEAESGSAETHLELGQALQAQGKTDLALAQFDAALQAKPDFMEAEVLRILTHLREKKYDAALQAIAQFKSRHPRSPLPDGFAASVYADQKNYPRARQLLEQALALDPKYLTAHAGLARLALLQNDTATARRHYLDVLKQDDDHIGSLLALADLELRAGKRKEATAWVEKARQKHPEALQPALALINIYLGQKEALKALSIARDIQNTYAGTPAALEALAQAQLAAGEVNSAVSSYRKLAEKLPKSPQVQYLLAQAQARVKDFKAAASSLNKALELNPNFLPASIGLAELEVQNKRPQEALRIARQIQKQQDKFPAGYELEGDIHMSGQAYSDAAKAYAVAFERDKSGGLALKLSGARKQAGDTAGAYQVLAQWLAEHPDDMGVRIILASTYQVDRKGKEAVEQYKKVLEKQPNNVVALNNLAWLSYEQGYPGAVDYAEKAYSLAPEQPVIGDTLGWILVQKGQVKRGLELLQAAASKASAAGGIRYHYAVALDKAGYSQEARKELERLLKNNGEFNEAADARALLKKLGG
ncbi:MAG: PEP-CTERM system TPR-repeat protein PrsT [Gammaproteobacteria bacterium]|nr:PEP-CTERM system TPR-repeat protein PrsT [Gammaproteobacteria bacterium]